jgi:hypothetical protein
VRPLAHSSGALPGTTRQTIDLSAKVRVLFGIGPRTSPLARCVARRDDPSTSRPLVCVEREMRYGLLGISTSLVTYAMAAVAALCALGVVSTAASAGARVAPFGRDHTLTHVSADFLIFKAFALTRLS